MEQTNQEKRQEEILEALRNLNVKVESIQNKLSINLKQFSAEAIPAYFEHDKNKFVNINETCDCGIEHNIKCDVQIKDEIIKKIAK